MSTRSFAERLSFAGWLWRFPLLVASHVVLFTVGSAAFAPPIPGAVVEAPSAMTPLVLVAIAVVDVALLSFLVRRSRYHGVKLAAIAAAFFYFVKTATSMVEAIYFMKNVTAEMLPGLCLMTVPLALALPALAVVVLGRARKDDVEGEEDALVAPPMTLAELLAKIVFLSAVVYPLLFFAFGYFVAWRSPELRAFYGDLHADNVFQHYAITFRNDPFLYPLEIFRGALWVVAAAFMLWSTRGPRLLTALVIALSFALIQNDVHWLPNPLMTPDIRLHHFIETSTSNFINAVAICALLGTAFKRAAAPSLASPTARFVARFKASRGGAARP